MGLSERLKGLSPPVSTVRMGSLQARALPGGEADPFQSVKTDLHRVLVDRLDFERIEQLEPEVLGGELRRILAELLDNRDPPVPLNRVERERVVAGVIHEVTGFGPLEPLLA